MLLIPLPIPWLSIYVVTIYFVWYVVIRLGLLGAWLYSEPGTIRFRQWLVILISILPFGMEIISSILVVFALAMGFNPVRISNETATSA